MKFTTCITSDIDIIRLADIRKMSSKEWEILPLDDGYDTGAYIKLNNQGVDNTIEVINGIVFADMSHEGDVVGIEVLYANKYLTGSPMEIMDVSIQDIHDTSDNPWMSTDDPAFMVKYNNKRQIVAIRWQK